jgi:ATP-dependent Lon protease
MLREVIEKTGGPENASTLRRMAELSVKEGIRLSLPALERARPRREEEIVGQEGPFRALMGCLCTPFPQHVILYGPPGVGKTTAAKIALEAAKRSGVSPFLKGAPFVETDGSTLRVDRQGGLNPLIGSVHDPIYQGASREFAAGGIPEPKPGLTHQAHGGVLFIDEIGEMDPILQNMLLKVLEEKRVFFDSPYYDPANPAIPRYMRQIFESGVPADFVMIGATTRAPEELSPALRSRCAEIFFNPLEEEDLERIILGTAERLGLSVTKPAARLLAGISGDGRGAVRLLLSAHALYGRVGLRAVRDALDLNARCPGKEAARVGRIAALGLKGQAGCVLVLEAAALRGEGRVEIGDAAGYLARDAVRNAQVALRRLGLSFAGVDLFLSVEGGAQIDGPSIGLAAAIVMLSAMTQLPIRQDLAVSGEISLYGEVLPVGGLTQKRAAARLKGYAELVLPKGSGGWDVFEASSLLEAAARAMALPEEALRRAIESPRGVERKAE